jgi:hypothetical protein
MTLQVDQGRFCSLSSNRDWQNWLRDNDEALYNDLMKTRAAGRGCNANKEKMKQIYANLYERGKGDALEGLIKQRFAYLIVGGSGGVALPSKVQEKVAPKTPKIAPPVKVWAPTNASNLNKHGVFEAYRPNILTFPKKMIFVNPSRTQLEAIVKHFLRDKISFDFIIVDDRAYVEYFESSQQTEAGRIPRESRDIYKYRLKHGSQ